MSFFRQPKPRRFTHEPIYYDEHRDRVRKIEERARKELKEKDDKGYSTDDIHGAFTGHIHQRRERRNSIWRGATMANTAALIVIILVLLIVWYYLSR